MRTDAFLILTGGVRAGFGLAPDEALSPDGWTALVALWSTVHGYAHLAIAGRFDRLGGVGREAFMDATLQRSGTACRSTSTMSGIGSPVRCFPSITPPSSACEDAPDQTTLPPCQGDPP